MTLLPKEKDQRNKLILAILGIAVVTAALYFGVISSQSSRLAELKLQRKDQQEKVDSVEKSIKDAKKIAVDLAQKKVELSSNEADMASGDAYLWMVNTLREFKLGHGVDISQFSATSYPDVGLLPRFPYKQVSITIGGTAYYHDLGTFIADFENHFRHMRVKSLILEPPGIAAGDRDKLSFRMEIVALIKSGTQ